MSWKHVRLVVMEGGGTKSIVHFVRIDILDMLVYSADECERHTAAATTISNSLRAASAFSHSHDVNAHKPQELLDRIVSTTHPINGQPRLFHSILIGGMVWWAGFFRH